MEEAAPTARVRRRRPLPRSAPPCLRRRRRQAAQTAQAPGYRCLGLSGGRWGAGMCLLHRTCGGPAMGQGEGPLLGQQGALPAAWPGLFAPPLPPPRVPRTMAAAMTQKVGCRARPPPCKAWEGLRCPLAGPRAAASRCRAPLAACRAPGQAPAQALVAALPAQGPVAAPTDAHSRPRRHHAGRYGHGHRQQRRPGPPLGEGAWPGREGSWPSS